MNRCWCNGCSFLKIKTNTITSHGLLWRFKNRQRKNCVSYSFTSSAESSRGKSNEKIVCSLMLRKEINRVCVWSKTGRTGIWSAFHFFLHFIQFGSLRSHKYILTLGFKLINFTAKETDVVWKEHVPVPLFPAISKFHVCKKTNPFSGFFSCKDLAICFLFQRQATWACATHPTTLTISSSMGHADWKIQD